MENRKLKKQKAIIASVISVITLLAIVSVFGGSTQSGFARTLSNSISMVEYYIIKKPIEFVSDIFSEYNALKDVYEENKILKKQLESYASLEARYEILQEETNNLKEISEVKHLPSEYQTKVVGVQTRDATNWNDEIVIDAGSANGLSTGMCVVDSKGLVGVITNTTEVSSTVSLITAENPRSKLPVMILNGEETVYGLIDGYNVNKKELNVIMLSNIDKLEKNAKVYTSGLGGEGKSPRGIYVGKAKKLSTEKDGTTTKMTVKLAGDFEDLNYLLAVKKVNGNE